MISPAHNERVAYKVVRINGNNLVSCFAPNSYLVKYLVGKSVGPTKKDTKLFAFGRRDYAEGFIRIHTNYNNKFSLFKCIVANPISHKEFKQTRIAGNSQLNTIEYNKVWRLINKWFSGEKVDWNGFYNDGYNGCIWCDKIKLIEELEVR